MQILSLFINVSLRRWFQTTMAFHLLMFCLKFWKDKLMMRSLALFTLILPTGNMIFFPGKSTVSQLSQVVHQFANALERRQQADITYLNFSKPFDRVSHENLLFKLECLGIGGSLLAWFRSYLSSRRHRVVLDNKSSDFLPITSRVPQGSILGPLLFLIFIKDMPDVIPKETLLPLFADDSKCFPLILGWDDGDKLQDDLNQIFQWSPI